MNSDNPRAPADGSVVARRKHSPPTVARLIGHFSPVISNPSAVRRATVSLAAKSLPCSFSEYPSHLAPRRSIMYSPSQRFCASVPPTHTKNAQNNVENATERDRSRRESTRISSPSSAKDRNDPPSPSGTK